jgi:ABC-type transport system involved in cytochrome c biogenesis ATPase subunit
MVQLLHAMNPAATCTLEVRGLQIRKGGDTLLTDFSWTHRPGEIAWVVGENGAGKSSLLRILAGRERPQVGSVRHSAPAVNQRAPAGERPGGRPEVTYYHPDMNLPDQITVGDWLRFLEGIAPASDRYPLAADLLPAGALPHKRVERLSTGEAKRLILVGLLTRAAPFLILDEPFEHLSREGKEMLTSHLVERAATQVVICATNQEIPDGARGQSLRYNDDRLLVTSGKEFLP